MQSRHWLFVILLVAALAFVGLGRLPGWPGFGTITRTGYLWVVLLGGVALLLGVVNVLWVHIRRIAQPVPPAPCSSGSSTP